MCVTSIHLYEMSIGKVWGAVRGGRGGPPIVGQPEAVANLVTETKVAQRTTLITKKWLIEGCWLILNVCQISELI